MNTVPPEDGSRSAQNSPPAASAADRTLAILRQEHRQLGGVLILLHEICERCEQQTVRADFELLAAALAYVDAFPERFHHPKESKYLFSALRERDPDYAALIERLEHDHRQSEQFYLALCRSFVAYQSGQPDAAENFRVAFEAFGQFHFEHMRTEEVLLLPALVRSLTDADWQVALAAFEANDDPLRGIDARGRFDSLRERIAAMAPTKLRRLFRSIDEQLSTTGTPSQQGLRP